MTSRQLSSYSSEARNIHSVASALLYSGGSDRKSTRLNSSHGYISYAVFCLKKKKMGRRLGARRRAARNQDRLEEQESTIPVELERVLGEAYALLPQLALPYASHTLVPIAPS